MDGKGDGHGDADADGDSLEGGSGWDDCARACPSSRRCLLTYRSNS